MPLRLEIKKKLSARSERVKCCDFHPTEPWILASLYSGHVFIWNYVSQSMVKSIEVCELPVRAARFIPSKQWIVCGADDMQIRVYNYNTMERLRTFEAHTDYIRSLAVHPTLPYLLSSSDDMLIKLWDWEKGWDCLSVFEGHTHYVMQVEFNPKDSNTFASASLDRSVKIWGLTSSTPHFQLEGHERGVNCIGYFRGGDRPYLVSGADDHQVRVWDYQTKACVATLEGHTSNVSAVAFHPELPIIISGSEDGTVRIWHASTYRLENTLNYGMERVWSIACLKGSNKVAIGYDDGTIMIKIGHEEPVASMERGGKIVWANNHEIVLANVRTSVASQDGDRLDVQSKDLGSCELYPQSISHDPKGRLLCACGDGEYIIYTALALKNKSFGSALEFVWANDSGVYATRESISKVKVFKEFKEHKAFRPAFAAESIFGGALLGVRSSDFIDFYDWSECRIIRRIDVCPRRVFWSESGELVVLACESSFYILRYNAELVSKFQDAAIEVTEQGIENSFELEQEVAEKVRNGYFVGDCFPEVDTRVLTDSGFLFLSEIEERVERKEEVLFACFDTDKQSIVYSPGSLVIRAAPARWVDFTEAATRRLWGTTSTDYSNCADRAVQDANHISIRTTPRHEMYVQLGTQSSAQKSFMRQSGGADVASHKMFAEELAPGFDCSCAADGKECCHGYSTYQLTTGAASGISHADVMSVRDTATDSPAVCLGLRSDDELNAFLELYGYWLGDGSMEYANATAFALLFTPKKLRDGDYLLGLIQRLRLKAWEWTADRPNVAVLTVRITAARWIRYFDEEYGLKYKDSPRWNREEAIAKLGNSRSVVAGRRGSLSAATTETQATPRSRASERRSSVSCSSRGRTPSSADVDMELEVEDEDAALPPARRASPQTSGSFGAATTRLPAEDEEEPVVTFRYEEDQDEADGSVAAPIDLTGEDEAVKPEPDDDDDDDDEPEDDEPREPDEELPAKSCQWFLGWVLSRLNRQQVRLVIDGLRQADGATARSERQEAAGSDISGMRRIYTSSVAFRDTLVQACLHAGYSAYFSINTRAGTCRGYNAVPTDYCVYSQDEMEQLLQAEPSRVFRPVRANHDSWSVRYSESTSALLAAADVRFDGKPLRPREKKKYSQGYVALHSDGRPVVRAAKQHELGAVIGTTEMADAYSPRDGRTWCVEVQHGDHLIFVQRAHRNAAGIVTKASRPVVTGNCFIYTNAAGRLNYSVGGEIITLAHLSKPYFLLGYLPKENRVYLMDKQHNIVAYSLLLSILVYQTAIVRRDMDGAKKALQTIPVDHHNKLARFLESQDLKSMALQLTTDSEHKFELAIACGELELAKDICVRERESEAKWKQLGDLALSSRFDLQLTLECYSRASDFGGLLLIYSAAGDAKGMEELAEKSRAAGRNNVAFLCYFLLHRLDDCVQLLTATDRIPEAAFLTRTYSPSSISSILALWKENVRQVSVTAAEALADPTEYSERFPELEWAVRVEKWREQHEGRERLLDARTYGEGAANGLQTRQLIEMMKAGQIGGDNRPQPPQQQTVSSNGVSNAAVIVKTPPTATQPPAAAAPAPLPAPPAAAAAPPAPAAVAVPPPTAAPVPATPAPAAAPTVNSGSLPITRPPPAAASSTPVKTAPAAASSTPSVVAAPPAVIATVAASPARPAIAGGYGAPPAVSPFVPSTPDRAKITPPSSQPSSVKPSPVATPTARSAAPAPASSSLPSAVTASASSTPSRPVSTAASSFSPSPASVSKQAASSSSASTGANSSRLPVSSIPDFEDDDFAELEGEHGVGGAAGGVPSLDDINSSLADIDDEFKEFE